jgi:5,10-methylenetetrahydromethanopterin reductase
MPTPLLSCGLPPSKDVEAHARHAESLGYHRVWLYDSPALYGDVWMAVGRVAAATGAIGVGTAVAVPSLRHVMVTASAIATVEELWPGRLVAAFGTGFTARVAMGQRGMRWADLDTYMRQLAGLLRGEVVEVDGRACKLISSPGFGAPRPIEVPLAVAPMGPRGFAVARDLGVGILTVSSRLPDRDWPFCACLAWGTVLDDGEDHTSARVRAAAGPWYTTDVHVLWELRPDALRSVPGGAEWLAALERDVPAAERYLAVHEGHAAAVSDRDQGLLDAAGPALTRHAWTGDRAHVRSRLEAAAASGVTEVIYAPVGPDIGRELEAFASAAG